jgi:nucleoid-associated protein YgaU
MSMFEEVSGGGSDKKKKWMMIGIGTGLIAIFLVIRNSMRNAAATQTVADTSQITPEITDQGSYPSDSFGGGISGTGMDQTLATYLAIADQNTSTQYGALNDQLKAAQDQWTTTNQNLQDQITAMNVKVTTNNIVATPQPLITSTPHTTAHPTPTSITHVVAKGETLSGIVSKQYGKQPAYASGIKTVAAMNKLANPNKISVGQKIVLPAKI